MTHTSQRRGLDPSRPGEEVVFLAMIPQQHKSKEGIGQAMRELAAKMLEHGPTNWATRNFKEIKIPAMGDARERLATLSDAQLLTTFAAGMSALAAVYSDVDKVESLVRDLQGDWLARNRAQGYPISVVLSALKEDVHRCCQAAGLKEHTYLHSLGFFGKVEELPTGDELAAITMCGHGLISKKLVRSLVRSIADGELTPEEAADDLVRSCVCGVANKGRGAEMLRRLSEVA